MSWKDGASDSGTNLFIFSTLKMGIPSSFPQRYLLIFQGNRDNPSFQRGLWADFLIVLIEDVSLQTQGFPSCNAFPVCVQAIPSSSHITMWWDQWQDGTMGPGINGNMVLLLKVVNYLIPFGLLVSLLKEFVEVWQASLAAATITSLRYCLTTWQWHALQIFKYMKQFRNELKHQNPRLFL